MADQEDTDAEAVVVHAHAQEEVEARELQAISLSGNINSLPPPFDPPPFWWTSFTPLL